MRNAASRVIFLITDDEDLARLVVEALDRHSFRLLCESDVNRAITTCARGGYCLVLVDAAADGVALPLLVHAVRRQGPVPLIVISIDRDPANAARILEDGADDCVGRPVAPDELVARVRAVLRRTRRPFEPSTHPFEVDDIRIEPATRIVSVNAKVIDCTTIEYDILEYLARQAGHVVSREELVLAVCGRYPTPLDRALDVHISHLRQKLRYLGQRIVTVRGVGYMLRVSNSHCAQPDS